MSKRRDRPSREPDVEIGAIAKARKLRFRSKPKTKVEFEGRTRVRSDHARARDSATRDTWEEVEIESGSESERRNLPDEVEPGVTYRDVEVGWAAGARAVLPEGYDDDHEDDEDER